jgi:hypothetical protein
MPGSEIARLTIAPGSVTPGATHRLTRLLVRLLSVVIVAAGLVGVSATASSANQPTPPFDEVTSLGVEPVPADCPRTTDPRWLATNDTDVYRLCRDALRLATTTQAQRAILYAFSKLGTPYSQDINKRRTTHFDCSSFVGRAYTAADARVRKANGWWVDFFPYFGWTGAYVPIAYWDAWSRYGYEGTNVYRVASVNNFRTGETIPNFAATRADANGNICIWQSAAGHVLWDQVWAGDAIEAKKAERLLDTRDSGLGLVPADSVQVIDVGVPSVTVMANLTITGPQANGYTTVYPCSAQRPSSSNSNYLAWTTVPNFVVAQADENGQVCVYTHAPTHMVWDQSVVTEEISADVPVRRYDSREEPTEELGGNSGERVAAEQDVVVAEGLEPGITVMGNLTVTNPVAGGFTTMFPCAQGAGGTSVNNSITWQTTANFTAVPADDDGNVCMRSTTATHVIWDQMAQTFVVDAAETKRLYDSRSPGIM